MLSQEFGVGTSILKVQRQCRTPRWHCERWFWFVCSVYWTRIISISSASRKSFGHCFNVQDKQLVQYPLILRRKWKMPQRYLKIPKSECPDIWIPLPRHKMAQNHGPVWKIQSFLSKGPLYDHPLAGLLWKRQFGKVLLEHGKSF